jgi:hypothetical protein
LGFAIHSVPAVRVRRACVAVLRGCGCSLAHVIACTWLNSGLDRDLVFHFSRAFLSFVHMVFIIFMGITLLLHE